MDKAQQYWKGNLRLVIISLIIWFVVSFGFGILFADALDGMKIGGYKLGFWFAQQGSMYIFVALIFIYAANMNKLDRKFDVHEN